MPHLYTRREQKSLIKSDINSRLIEHSLWNVLSLKWFNRWKKYVNYDSHLPDLRSSADSYHPGPIDNTDIMGKNERELKRNLLEGLDFVLLPCRSYHILEVIYKGGPHFERKVISLGTVHSRQLQVELYPIRVQVFLDEMKCERNDVNWQPSKVLLLSRRMDIKDAFFTICDSLHVNDSSSRLWVRMDFGNNIDNDCAGAEGRKLTADVTDTVNGWRFLRETSGLLLSEINLTAVDVMVERKVRNTSGEWHWPKDESLNEWKYHLKIGDMIDAKDEFDDWYESVVESGDEDFIRVHFKGWSKQFDRTILRSEYESSIAPLYTITNNWRDALVENDRVDFAPVLDVCGSKWHPAYVTALDRSRGAVKVKYRDEYNVVRSFGEWIDLYGDSIAKAATHVKKYVEDFSDASAFSSEARLHTTYSSRNTYNNSPVSSSNRFNGYNTWGTRISNYVGAPEEIGVVGLMNLRNTCFMNSMLQCLSHTKRLTDVFISDHYVPQLNKTNPLGHGGMLASSYAKLIKDMWCGKYTVVVPEDFKRIIGEFQPQFSGYQQQDSQEFMLFLLDGLHEDLNRVVKKPYVEKLESDGSDDELIARKSWGRFLLRNDSELVDSCFGQLRSHVTCVNCGYESVTFDEYSSLSLPLPIKNIVVVVALVYPLPYGSAPVEMTFEMDVICTVEDVKKKIASKLSAISSTNIRRKSGENGDFVMVEHGKSTGFGASTSVSFEDEDRASGSSGSEVHVDAVADLSDDECEDIEVEVDVKDVDTGDTLLLSTSKHGTVRSTERPDGFCRGYFHLCTIDKGRGSKINKTFEDRTSAKELGKTTYDAVVAYELEYPALNVIRTTSYYGSSKLASDSPYGYCDLLMGATQSKKYSFHHISHSTSLYFDLFGPPYRFSYYKGHTTVGDIHQIVWRVMQMYVRDDSLYYNYNPQHGKEGAPYEIHVTSSYGYASKSRFSDVMKEKFVLSPYDSLICVWKDDARDAEHFDESALSKLGLVGRGATESTNWRHTSALLDIDDDNILEFHRKASLKITDCLGKFVEREQMPPEETWYCPMCKKHLAPVKKFDLWTSPDILIIHLKRFQYISGTYFVQRDKLGQLVDFPIDGTVP